MSTYFRTTGSSFLLLPEKEGAAVAAICKNYLDEKRAEQVKTFSDAMEALGWQYDGEYKELCVEGLKKLDSEDDMFALIAEFVEPGSYIDCQLDDGYPWRYYFYNGQCLDLGGQMYYGTGSFEIEGMITLSTAHIAPETCDWLTKQCSNSTECNELVAFQKESYGWFIYVPEDGDDSKKIPEELNLIFDLARGLKCRLLCIDRDGSVYEELKTYEW